MPMAMMMIIMVIMTFPRIMFMKMAMIMVVIVMMFVVFSWRDHSVGPRFVIAPGAGDCVFVFMGTTSIVLPLSRQ
jgi:hypothetical protein